MKSENDVKVLDSTGVEIESIRNLFKQRTQIRNNDYARNNISIGYQQKQKSFIQNDKIVNQKSSDTHIIVSKDQLELIKNIQALSGMINTLQEVKEDVQFIKSIYTTDSTSNKKKAVISKEEQKLNLKSILLKIPKAKAKV